MEMSIAIVEAIFCPYGTFLMESFLMRYPLGIPPHNKYTFIDRKYLLLIFTLPTLFNTLEDVINFFPQC